MNGSNATPRRLLAALVATVSVFALQTAQAQTPREVTVGATVRGELTARDPKLEDESHYDDYRIRLRAGEYLNITMNSEAIDSLVSIGQGRGEDFSAIQSDDDGGGMPNAKLRFRAEEDGEYIIRANSVSGGEFGAYELTISPRPEPSPAKTAALAVGTSPTEAKGELADGGARVEEEAEQLFDNYTLQLRAGTILRANMNAEFDSRLRLFRTVDGTLEEVASDDDGGGNLNAQLLWDVDKDGAYTLRAEAINAEGAGPYTVSTITLPKAPDRAPRPRSIRKGQSIEGALEFGDPITNIYSLYDLYELRGRAGETVVIRLKTPSGGFDPMVAVGAMAGGRYAVIEENDDDPDSTETSPAFASKLTFTFQENGVVILRARALNDAVTGPYTISVE